MFCANIRLPFIYLSFSCVAVDVQEPTNNNGVRLLCVPNERIRIDIREQIANKKEKKQHNDGM